MTDRIYTALAGLAAIAAAGTLVALICCAVFALFEKNPKCKWTRKP